jgi:aspartyl aminopeptidase
MLWHTWLDRDLTVAGRVVVKDPKGGFASHLVRVQRPIIRIPSVAIHLYRQQAEDVKYNPETELFPILGLVSDALNSKSATSAEPDSESSKKDPLSTTEHHSSTLLTALASELSHSLSTSVSSSDIYDMALLLCDTQPSSLGGVSNEFVYSGRLDNLFSTFCAIEGLARSTEEPDWQEGTRGRLVVCWDNEEVGSLSAYGAESNFLEATLHRLTDLDFDDHPSAGGATVHQTIANSFLVSSDMGHAVHPGQAFLLATLDDQEKSR